MNDLRINQIIQALQLREESTTVNGVHIITPSITGDDRTALIAELVKLLTNG
jgi:hypothetical protein